MSKLNTLSGGYKGGSPRVRSSNSIKPTPKTTPEIINADELANTLKMWYVGGNLTKEGAQIVLDELNKIVS